MFFTRECNWLGSTESLPLSLEDLGHWVPRLSLLTLHIDVF